MSDIKEYEDKMKKSVDSLKEDYTTIRAGRANPHILDKIKVDYYGTPTTEPRHLFSRWLISLFQKQE